MQGIGSQGDRGERGSPARVGRWWQRALVGMLSLCTVAVQAAAPSPTAVTHPCRVEGLPNEVLCGSVKRPLDPDHPDGPRINVHYLLVPAMARNKQADAVLLLAGGPGQSAIDLAPAVLSLLARLNNRRDLVFVDQRGTGRSAPLQCADESRLPVQEAVDTELQLARLRQCREDLGKLPYGDLRFFTTSIAMQDVEAVREQLGVPQWNVVGASYGTRAALEYQRQFPQKVRRTVIDGVAPPDMVLPASFSSDGQAALDAMLSACEADVQGPLACGSQYPQLRKEWAALLNRLPQTLQLNHPVTGKAESFSLTRQALLRLVRTPLYVPALAAALPTAIHRAAQGDFAAIVGLSAGMGNRKSQRLAMGMHFSVVCAEDVPRLDLASQQPGADFGWADAQQYEAVCKFWPRGAVADAFYTVPPAVSPVLVLSGGADPATPPRHGAQVTKALGQKAQHIVVPQAGHGVMAIGCMRDVVYRFIAAAEDALALPQDAGCATKLPRPGVFLPVQVGVEAGAKL